MLYASKDGLRTIVAAADSSAEIEAFYADVLARPDRQFTGSEQPSPTDLLMNPAFRGLTKPPFVFEHVDTAQQDAFLAANGIKVVPDFILREKHEIMMAEEDVDAYSADAIDQRSLAEIHGLTENDRWDRRTPEQKAMDEHYKRIAEEAKARGELSGDSFDGPQNKEGESDLHVSRINVKKNDDGSITIGGVMASKGFGRDDAAGAAPSNQDAPQGVTAEGDTQDPIEAEPGEEFYRVQMVDEDCDSLDHWAEGLGLLPEHCDLKTYSKLYVAEGENDKGGWFIMRGEKAVNLLLGLLEFHNIRYSVEVVDAAGNVLRPFTRNVALAEEINPDGVIAIYHRVEVAKADLDDLLIALTDNGVDLGKTLDARGQTRDYAWIVARTKAKAEELAGYIKDKMSLAPDEIEVYAVNDKGERLAPKGVEIVEKVKEPEPPRPWNERAADFEAMSEEERKECLSKLTGDEFIFCVNYRSAADGCTVWIVPRSYFFAHGEMWDQPLPLALPGDFKELAPGVYKTYSRSNIDVINLLTGMGMSESLAFQLYVNNL